MVYKMNINKITLYKFCFILMLLNIGFFFYRKFQKMSIMEGNVELDSIKSLLLAVSRQLNETTALYEGLQNASFCYKIIKKYKQDIRIDLREIDTMISRISKKYSDGNLFSTNSQPIASTEKSTSVTPGFNKRETDVNYIKNKQDRIGTKSGELGMKNNTIDKFGTKYKNTSEMGTINNIIDGLGNIDNIIEKIKTGGASMPNSSFNGSIVMPSRELTNRTGEVIEKENVTSDIEKKRVELNQLVRNNHDALFPNNFNKLSTVDFTSVRRRLDLQYIYKNGNSSEEKLIYVTYGGRDLTNSHFDELNCINKCRFVTNSKIADAVVFKNHVDSSVTRNRQKDQVWVYVSLESPFVTHPPADRRPNWTATYRPDSVVPIPYQIYQPNSDLDVNGYYRTKINRTKNYAQGKTKLVAWFVSNCHTQNNRIEYVHKLERHIEVDVYGRCGPLKCSKSYGGHRCFDVLTSDYKFYLSFENANCRGYITEKLFNAYRSNVLPIVMGAHPDDYATIAPPHSFLHVDDFKSPEDLANYLKVLDKNDTLYNSYFTWKEHGGFQNTKFICRLCAMLHAAPNYHHVTYENIGDWWRSGVCKSTSVQRWV